MTNLKKHDQLQTAVDISEAKHGPSDRTYYLFYRFDPFIFQTVAHLGPLEGSSSVSHALKAVSENAL
jgi:hypothetical protein